MKKLLILLFACMLCMPLYAQLKLGPKAQRIRSGRLLQPRVSTLSRMTNAALERRLNQIAQIPPATGTIKRGHPRRPTFQLQFGNDPHRETASAFAIKLNNKVWGVAAGHVMQSIIPQPHMKIEETPDNFITVPVKKYVIGNPDGIDVALFEIPEQTLPYLTILEPAERSVTMREAVDIPGFAFKEALWISNEKVLLATPLRLFIQKTSDKNLRGFCGSPVLLQNGRVRGVYAGFADADILSQYAWFNDLPGSTRKSMSNLHYAIPIEAVELMARGIEQNGSLLKNGMMMQVLGRPVALLHPNEYIHSVEQFRNGEKIGKQIFKDILIDPSKLEQFFELEENDVLRITLNRRQTPQVRDGYVAYDVNVSTGQVTMLRERDLFGRP